MHTYGSSRELSHNHHPSLSNPIPGDRDLPMYGEADTTRRRYGEKESIGYAEDEKRGLVDDDQGKWGSKGHGAGPGYGGRRGLPPKQRLDGWVGH